MSLTSLLKFNLESTIKIFIKLSLIILGVVYGMKVISNLVAGESI